MKSILKQILILFIVAVSYNKTNANGITISNLSFLPSTNQIQFDVSWENSWRSDVLQNWDAAYIFAKFKNQNGKWEDVYFEFNNNNNIAPIGYNINSQGIGVVLLKSQSGTGNSNIIVVKIAIDNVNMPVPIASGAYDVKIFGIEMVYIPKGQFWAGDNSSGSAFKPLTGTFTTLNVNSGSIEYLSSPIGITNFDPLTASVYLNSTGSAYPTGYNAFYSMKYEISQGAYRDFLNTLSITQQSSHIAVSPTSVTGTNAFGSFLNSASIEIAVPGIAGTTPAIFGCDISGNNIYNEANDGEWVSCNYLTWADIAAYLSWAGLSPMTELQYEKICRGPLQPVPGEYPWGNATINAGNLSFTNAYQASETVSNASTTIGNANYNSVFNNPNVRPSRNGVFATPTSNRITSGGAFYGVMDLGGNLWERVITTARPEGLAYSPTSYGGILFLSATGFSKNSVFPGYNNAVTSQSVDGSKIAYGLMYRGGAHDSPAVYLRTSERSLGIINTADNLREGNLGGRGVLNLF